MPHQLWMSVQFSALTVAVTFGLALPQSSLHALVLILVGAAALAPLLPCVVEALLRALSLAPDQPPIRSRVTCEPVHRALGAPGTPGAALVRAPAGIVPALA